MERACFDHPLFTPLVKGSPPLGFGDDQKQDTQHQTDGVDSSFFVTYAHSLGEDTTGHTGPHGRCAWEQSE